jgi:hypothetical protein
VGVLAIAIAALIVAALPASDAATSASRGPCPVGDHLVPTSVAVLCAHDTAEGIPTGARSASARPASPHCYGDGVDGDRVQLLYVHATGTPIRAGISDRIVHAIVPAIEGLVRNRSRGEGREIGVRWLMPSCKLRVDLVELSDATLAPTPTANDQVGRIIDALSALGYRSRDRKYLAWVDAESGPTYANARGTGPCGVGTVASMDTRPVPNAFDQPTPTNYNDGVVPQYALAFATTFSFISETECWGAGTTGADTEAHELFHTLGAVQLSAPNSNGYGHCTVAPDLMCYTEHGVAVHQACAGFVKVLDCTGDDYFNANPPAGSYLVTHWNIANSSFLGDSPLDALPVKVPRTSP